MAPGGPIDQIGTILLRLIRAFAKAQDCANIFQARLDIKYGFWRLDCKEGEESNFCYVLAQKTGIPIKLVVPMSLQMGWIESPAYFCTLSKTGPRYDRTIYQYPSGIIGKLMEINPDFAEMQKSDVPYKPFN